MFLQYLNGSGDCKHNILNTVHNEILRWMLLYLKRLVHLKCANQDGTKELKNREMLSNKYVWKRIWQIIFTDNDLPTNTEQDRMRKERNQYFKGKKILVRTNMVFAPKQPGGIYKLQP